MRSYRTVLFVALLVATPMFATTFVVPADEEMIAKADVILAGTIDSHYADEARMETVYEVRVDQPFKGLRTRELLQIVSPGAELQDRGVYVPGAAHFEDGEHVLLFLTRDARGRFTPTDLTLGKFKFETSTTGDRLLVRDAENIAGWNRSGSVHVEQLRRETPFLRFIEERLAGRGPKADYFASPSSVMLPRERSGINSDLQPDAPLFSAKTYTDNIQLNGVYIGTRWSNIAAGVIWYKRTETNIAGAADGGASVIQNGLASWTNECGSVINLVYGGNRSGTPSANHDGISVVEFNDPQGRIAGSWLGAGTVAITFISYFDPHTFNGETWWSIHDADVVFQDGYTASNSGFATAMTHELGHGIGFRHSNAHYIRTTGADEPCNSSVEECSNSAIMYFQVISGFGYTLQTWDINAAQAVYPGGSCTGSGTVIFADGFEQTQSLPGRWTGKTP